MKLRLAVLGAAALGGAALASGTASAMPTGPLIKHSNIEQVRWVCDPWGRCWWTPNYYGAYAFYGPDSIAIGSMGRGSLALVGDRLGRLVIVPRQGAVALLRPRVAA